MLRRQFLKLLGISPVAPFAFLGKKKDSPQNDDNSKEIQNDNLLLLQLYDKDILRDKEIVYRIKLLYLGEPVIKQDLTINQQQQLLQEYDKGKVSDITLINKLLVETDVKRNFRVGDEVIVRIYDKNEKLDNRWIIGKVSSIFSVKDKDRNSKHQEDITYWIADKNKDIQSFREKDIDHWNEDNHAMWQTINNHPVFYTFKEELNYYLKLRRSMI